MFTRKVKHMVLGLWLISAVLAQAGITYYVSPKGDDANGGRLPFRAVATIQRGIDLARPGDTIMVLDGIYTGNGNRDLDFYGKAITVRSKNGPESCIIDCGGTEAEPHRAFKFHNGEDLDSIVDGFTITNGYALLEEWDDAIEDIVVTTGGGIFCYNSSPFIKDCIFKSSCAQRGGALGCKGATHIVVQSCIFINNTASENGGGVILNGYLASNPIDVNPVIKSCFFSNNSAGNSGGAVITWHCNAVFENCVFTSNIAANGAGIQTGAWGTAPRITNIINCTIVNNMSSVYGGGIGVKGGSLVMVNAILWDNTSPSGPQMDINRSWDDSSALVRVSYCDVQNGGIDIPVEVGCSLFWGGGNINMIPGFVNSHSGWTSADELAELNSDNPAIPYEHTSAPFVTSDGSRMYFHRWYSDTSYQQIFYADLNPITGRFENPQRVIITNEENNDLVGGPRISADGQRMYYHGASSLINGEKCIKLAQWVPSGESGYWEHVKDFVEIHYTGSQEAFVFLNDDESCLYFESSRPGGLGDLDIWTASRSLDPQNPDYTTPFSNPTNVTELNSNKVERSPQIMPDGLTMYFSSSRERSSSIHLDVYKATRSSVNDPFGNITRISLVGTPYENSVGRAFVTENGQTIYFQGYRDESTTDLTSIYLSDYVDEDWHLTSDSPCIDAGTNEPEGGLPPTDIDGNPRLIDGNGDGLVITDMGAYEYFVSLREQAIAQIETITVRKAQLIDEINHLMTMEQDVRILLGQMLNGGNVEGLSYHDISAALNKVSSARQHEKQAAKHIDKSIAKLKGSLAYLSGEENCVLKERDDDNAAMWADINGDGVVDLLDMVELQRHWLEQSE